MKGRWKYMLSNLITVMINNSVLMLIVMIPLKASEIAYNNRFGLFYSIDMDYGWAILFSIVILDVAIYFQHRVFHRVDLLWRLHRVHHVDPMLDTTTGFRFHPIEIIISNFIKVGIIFLIGAPVFSVLLFEIILNTTSMFNHSNIKIHRGLEKILRIVLITPDLHLIHHSVKPYEMNSNFGFSVPWWDWLFNTYTAEPEVDYQYMKLGVSKMPSESTILFPGLLIYPFEKAEV